ncbi:spore protease YyaC [Sporosarcina sp. HYO08]|uniref:spore protease YyaC n=1 Tax=Sporosarcina sp. HYO08 TaxID=1759557 RepID=UPI000791BCCA|nr:spore protease YyaC [Sporosarcina sp. HYO08]KXH81945.1 hypothetical protein AU377_06715 [Sporosarcina sp. HYO08]
MFSFKKKKTVRLQESKLYFHYSAESSTEEDLHEMSFILNTCYQSCNEIVFLCIGSDRSTGDAYGPLVGTMLEESHFPYPVFGTISEPVHAINLEKVLKDIHSRFTDPMIIGVDACLGDHHQIGSILLKEGPFIPGNAIGNPLIEVGTYHLKAVVNYLDPHFPVNSLNTTRLDTVMNLSKITSAILLNSVKKVPQTK